MSKVKGQMIVSGSLLIYCLILNSVAAMFGLQSAFTSILLGISCWSTLMSYLTLSKLPLIAIGFTFLAQWAIIIDDLIKGVSFTGSLSNTGFFDFLGWIAIPVITIILYGKAKKQGQLKNKTFWEKVKTVVTFEKEPYKAPIWAQFAVWCMILTVIFLSANEEQMKVFNDSIIEKFYASCVLVLPSVIVYMKYLNSNMTYQAMIISLIFKTISIGILYIKHMLALSQAIYFIVEAAVIIYATYRYIKMMKEKEKDIK